VQELKIDEDALEGMLEQLANRGTLREGREMLIQECEAGLKAGAYGNLCAFLTHGNSATCCEIGET